MAHIRQTDAGRWLLTRTFVSAKGLWSLIRYTRWLLWLAFLAYSLEFVFHRAQHMNSLGQLLPTTEAWMFGLGLAAVATGLLELKMRETAGVKRAPENKIGFDR